MIHSSLSVLAWTALVLPVDSPPWSEVDAIEPDAVASGDQLGSSVDLDQTTAVVGAPNDADNGSVFVFVESGGSWEQEARLRAQDGAPLDAFGSSVALSGDTLAIGAPWTDDTAVAAGSVYVFVRAGTVWAEQAELQASDVAQGDLFGSSVAIEGDTLVVGVMNEDDGGMSAGAAYVFVRNGTDWSEQAKLTAFDASPFDLFGRSVAISGDKVVVGAPGVDDIGSDSGAAYLYSRSGTDWTATAKLLAHDAEPEAEFGYSASIDGDTLVVGARTADAPELSQSNGGAVYFFGFNGLSWSPQGQIDGNSNDALGSSVSLDGDRCAVGAIGDSPGGVVLTYARTFPNSVPTWSTEDGFLSNDPANGEEFGGSVALSGSRCLVGDRASVDQGPDSGAAYLFELIQGDFELEQQLVPDESFGVDRFGTDVSLSGDRIAIGSFGSSAAAATGSVYIYNRIGSQWMLEDRVFSPLGSPFDAFGSAVSLFGDTLVVGAPGFGNEAGVVHVYERVGASWERQATFGPAAGGASGNYFGRAVALQQDELLIGSPQADPPSFASGAGKAFVFTRVGTVWTQVAELVAPDADNGDAFGISVALHNGTAVMGSTEDDDITLNSGAAYVFTGSGATWNFQQKLLGSEINAADDFGVSVSIENDTLVVGGDQNARGEAYVFVRQGGVWSEQAILRATDADAGDGFGADVCVQGDRALIGTSIDEDGGSGYIFHRTGTNWAQTSKLTTAAPLAVALGESVSLDGDLAVLGDPRHGPGVDIGAVRIFAPEAPLVSTTGTAYCFGDGGTQVGMTTCTECPCGNSLPGAEGGCLNSTGRSAVLLASGDALLANDTLRFEVCGANPLSFGLLFSGAQALPGSAQNPCFGLDTGIANVGNGLRCMGSSLVRHGTRPTDLNGNTGSSNNGWGPPSGPPGGLLQQGGYSAGQTRYFQVFYREDPLQALCGFELNTTNAISIAIQ